MPKYPASIDNSQSLPTAVDNFTPVQGSVFNRLRDAVLSIENELGVKPSGIYSNVAGRLNNLEGIVGNLKIIEIQEDLGGTLESPLVIGLQGRPISTIAPAVGQVLGWNGIAWVPSANGSGGGGGGTLFVDQLTPPLTITFDRTDLFEVGEPVSQPEFLATYFFFPSMFEVPQTAFLEDSDNNIVQNVSSTPNDFHSNFVFTKNTFGATVTFTLTATIAPITKSVTNTITWGQKLYWGLGPAGQSGASFITSLTGQQITTSKDFAFAVNAGFFDKIYFSCRTAYGDAVFTVHDVEGGFTKTGTFVITNGFGFVDSYDLYESDNTNLGSVIVITGEGDDEFIGGGGPVGPPGPPGAPGTISAVIFDGGTTSQNARTDRSAHQSPINNAFNGIVNLSSDTTGITTGITGNYSTIGGGDQNIIVGVDFSTIGGGAINSIHGFNSFIGGGTNNQIAVDSSTIGGGSQNNISAGNFGFIGGGQLNAVTATAGVVCGGTSNSANANSFVGGGNLNTIGSSFGSIPGGQSNQVIGGFGVIGGGSGNFCAGGGSTIAGGISNGTDSDNATVSGGIGNSALALQSSIGGGSGNGMAISATGSTVSGGLNNFIENGGLYATIPGGREADARLYGQLVYSGGMFTTLGDAQISTYLVKGISVSGATLHLVDNAAGSLSLVNGFSYTIRATLTATRTDAQGCATFIHTLLVHCTGGVATIDSTNTTLSIPNGQAWTISYTTSGTNILASFTGTVGQTVRAMIKYEISEVGGGP